MKKIINKLIAIYRYGDVAFYISLLGPLIMGTIHLIFVILRFDWIVLNYCIFSYLMMLFKVWQWAIEKYHIKPNHYVAGIISILIVLAPMMASFILTIMYKDAPHYLFEWLVYAYALYGTIKMVFAVKGLIKKNKTDRQYVLSYLSLIGALYTIQMMEFRLIMFTSNGVVDESMNMMQLFTQGFIFVFSLFIAGLFIYKNLKYRTIFNKK